MCSKGSCLTIYGNFKGTILSIVYCSCGIAVLKLWLFLEHRGREWEGGRGKGVVEREREKGREGEGKCERGRGGERSTQYIPTWNDPVARGQSTYKPGIRLVSTRLVGFHGNVAQDIVWLSCLCTYTVNRNKGKTCHHVMCLTQRRGMLHVWVCVCVCVCVNAYTEGVLPTWSIMQKWMS